MALFITGHDRSGTTMLQRLCNHHPEMVVTDEFGSFMHLGTSYWHYSKRILENLKKVRNRFPFNPQYKMLGTRHLSNPALTLNFILRLSWHHHGRITLGDVETTLRKMYPQAKIVGDKRTLYHSHLPQLAAIDGLSGIIIYRDGRDVTSSFLQMARTSWKNQAWTKQFNSAAAVARRWVQHIELMEQYGGKYFIMRYENLVQDPRAELAALGRWLGVSPDGFPIANVKTASIGKYNENLTAAELADVLEIAGPTMARLGYV